MFSHLFSSGGFMPHGVCYLWNPGLVWLHLASDTLIAASYLSIPITLVYFIRKRRDLPFDWVFVCFGVFIVACGATHVVEIWNIWHADYWFAGAVKAVTALASVPTAILLVQLIPRALALPGPKDLESINVALFNRADELARANQALQATDEKFRLLVSGLSDYAIYMLDREGKVASWNAGAAKIKGYDADEIIGQHFSKFYTPEEVGRGKASEEPKIASEQGRFEGECRRVRKNGEQFWASILMTALYDEKGQLRGFAKVTRDITDRKKTEEALDRHRNDLASYWTKPSAKSQGLRCLSLCHLVRGNPRFLPYPSLP